MTFLFKWVRWFRYVESQQCVKTSWQLKKEDWPLTWGLPPWWPSLELLPWYPMFRLSYWKSFYDCMGTIYGYRFHDDVIKWKHIPRYWPFVRGIHRWLVNPPPKVQWHEALVFSLICVWINGWVNNREAGDLERYRAHYDVIVMLQRSLQWVDIGERVPGWQTEQWPPGNIYY